MLTGILPASEIPSSKDPNETILLESYRKLPNEEKEELMEIVQIILRKTEKREKEIIKSSPSKDTNETASSF